MSTRKKYGAKLEQALRGDFRPAKPRAKLSSGEMLRILREKNELTQLELATRAKLTQSTISSIENERIHLGVERAKALARALHVHPAALLFPSWDVDEESAA